jgi:hypothetical protein
MLLVAAWAEVENRSENTITADIRILFWRDVFMRQGYLNYDRKTY